MYTADSDCKGGGIWNEYSQTSSLFSLLSLFFILGYCFYSMFLYCHTQLPHFQLIIILFPFLVYWGLSFENLGFGKGKRENGSWYSDVNNTILHKDDNLIQFQCQQQYPYLSIACYSEMTLGSCSQSLWNQHCGFEKLLLQLCNSQMISQHLSGCHCYQVPLNSQIQLYDSTVSP